MRIRILAYVFFSICGLLASRTGFSQIGRGTGINIPFRKPGSDSIKVVKILNANTFHSEQRAVDSADISYWQGDVRIFVVDDHTLIYCDSMVMNPKANYLECYQHVHINDNDSTNIYSDYMKYQVDLKTIHFDRNVKLTDGKGVLTTEDLDYDLNTHIGVYNNGGKIVNKETVLTSRRGVYYETSKDVHFYDNVVMRDPQTDLFADSLQYNTESQIATFITLTKILFKDSTKRTVITRSGNYNMRTRKSELGLRPIITDGSQRITGDSVRFDDSTGLSTAKGRAVYSDTVQGVVLLGDLMVSDQKKKTFFATDHPVMIIKQDKDSLYLTADTFFSGRLIDAYQLQQRLHKQDSLHKVYIDSVEKVAADSLHNAMLSKRTPQDTLLAVTDSNGRQIIRDLSDSLHRGTDSMRRGNDSLRRVSDSLHRVSDSLRRALGDSLRRRYGDSLRRMDVDSLIKTDSLAKIQISDSLAMAKKISDSLHLADSLAKVKPPSGKKKGKPAGVNPSGGRPQPGGMGGPGGQRPPGGMKPADGMKLPEGTKPPGADGGPDSARVEVKKEPDKDRMSYVDTSAAPVTDTTLRYILGYHHVRIFSDSLQAVADSMFYSTRDSVFRLFTNPIAWGNGNYQITGDTMYVYTKNKKANRLYVFENGLAINKVASNFYNQIKGTTINTYFKNGDVDYMRAKGNAESIYYVKDDYNAYSGVNKAHADIIDMIFAAKEDSAGNVDTSGGRELRRVAMRNDVEGSMIPFAKVHFDDMRLRGFKWQESKRPKSKEELLSSAPAVIVTDSAMTDSAAIHRLNMQSKESAPVKEVPKPASAVDKKPGPFRKPGQS